ncbi:hypothetical protein AB0953_29115 [Streptomyces sp. NPDC046866]|uniref:hypothetical protein n=1 Tax=Streptomyces sp. NPDC046866 TaxID=3154921 RepID=UPI003451E605
MRITRILRRLTTVLVVAGTAVGCSKEVPSAAPRLPERSCFGVFTRQDLAPLVGKGTEVHEDGPVDMRLTAERRGATCVVDVDGEGRFDASVTRQALNESFFWNAQLIQPRADPLTLGDKGIVYDTGARVALTCTSPGGDSFQLEVTVGGSTEQMEKREARPLFRVLIAKLLAAAKRQTRCGSDAP